MERLTLRDDSPPKSSDEGSESLSPPPSHIQAPERDKYEDRNIDDEDAEDFEESQRRSNHHDTDSISGGEDEDAPDFIADDPTSTEGKANTDIEAPRRSGRVKDREGSKDKEADDVAKKEAKEKKKEKEKERSAAEAKARDTEMREEADKEEDARERRAQGIVDADIDEPVRKSRDRREKEERNTKNKATAEKGKAKHEDKPTEMATIKSGTKVKPTEETSQSAAATSSNPVTKAKISTEPAKTGSYRKPSGRNQFFIQQARDHKKKEQKERAEADARTVAHAHGGEESETSSKLRKAGFDKETEEESETAPEATQTKVDTPPAKEKTNKDKSNTKAKDTKKSKEKAEKSHEEDGDRENKPGDAIKEAPPAKKTKPISSTLSPPKTTSKVAASSTSTKPTVKPAQASSNPPNASLVATKIVALTQYGIELSQDFTDYLNAGTTKKAKAEAVTVTNDTEEQLSRICSRYVQDPKRKRKIIGDEWVKALRGNLNEAGEAVEDTRPRKKARVEEGEEDGAGKEKQEKLATVRKKPTDGKAPKKDKK